MAPATTIEDISANVIKPVGYNFATDHFCVARTGGSMTIEK